MPHTHPLCGVLGSVSAECGVLASVSAESQVKEPRMGGRETSNPVIRLREGTELPDSMDPVCGPNRKTGKDSE